MRKYTAFIITPEEQEVLFETSAPLHFNNGFAIERRYDWMGILQNKYLHRPVVSVRQGRDGWNELIVLTADGIVCDDETIMLDYNYHEEVIAILRDIFVESLVDEMEVFSKFKKWPTMSQIEWNKVIQWVNETYGEEDD